MKNILFLFAFAFVCISSFAQEKLIKDIDFDGKKDTVYLDREKFVIVCQLSTQDFKKTESLPIEILNEMSGIVDAKNGFIFFNDWMRAGYKNQFRYHKKIKKIQLIGMSRYEFGNAAREGSGESSVNLITHDYIGNWNYFDHLANHEEGELIKMPTIKTKMQFPFITLEKFSEEVYFEFSERCSTLYYNQKEKMKNQ